MRTTTTANAFRGDVGAGLGDAGGRVDEAVRRLTGATGVGG